MRIALIATILLIVGYELTVVTTASGGGTGGVGGVGVRSGGGGKRHRHQNHHNNNNNNHHNHQQSNSKPLSPMQMYRNQSVQNSAQGETEFGRWMPIGEAQALLRREATPDIGVDCCPSVVEMVEPEGGKNMDGIYVELYRDGHNRQRFYEVSCRPDVENKPCRFIDRRLHNQSRCVQKTSYTYALVRDVGSNGNKHFSGPTNGSGNSWTMDYIEVRSGCSCALNALTRHRHQRPSRHRNNNNKQTASRNAKNTP